MASVSSAARARPGVGDSTLMRLTPTQQLALEIILFVCAFLAIGMGFLDLLNMPVDDALDEALDLFVP
jgi:hypothetical protein